MHFPKALLPLLFFISSFLGTGLPGCSGLSELAGLGGIAFAAYGANLPLRPDSTGGLIESPGLSEEFKAATLTLLHDHQLATGEEIFLVVRAFEERSSLKRTAQEIYRHWRLGERGLGALLVVDTRKRRAHLTVGFGLGTQLDNERASEIITRFVQPELKDGNLDRAIGLGVYELLKSLNSPLITENRVREAFEEVGFRGSWESTLRAQNSASWIGWTFFGCILVLISLFFISATQTHYTAQGWFRTSLLWLLLPDKGKDPNEEFVSEGFAGEEFDGGIAHGTY